MPYRNKLSKVVGVATVLMMDAKIVTVVVFVGATKKDI